MDEATLHAYDTHPEAFARDWHAPPAPTDLRAAVQRYFTQGPTVDVGCGSGRDTAWLCEHGYPAIGVDGSEGLLEEARRRYPGVRFEHGLLPELAELGDHRFDNVLCETVIMHLGRDAVPIAVRRLVSLLAPGGTLYLTWRVTPDADRRDEHGRLYAAFDLVLVRQALEPAQILLDDEGASASSGKVIHRIVARVPEDRSHGTSPSMDGGIRA